MADELEAATRRAVRGDLVESQAREILKDIMKRAGSDETLNQVTIAGYLQSWLSNKADRKAEGTADRYRIVIDRFIEFLAEKARRPLTSLTPGDVDRFLNARLRAGVAPKTAVFDVKVIRTALNAARRQGLITTNAAEAVDLPDVEKWEGGTFTPHEVRMLLDAAEGEWRTLIMLGYYTGARLGDCCTAHWDGIDLAKARWSHVQQKTGNKVEIPLHPELLSHLEDLASTDRPSDFVIPAMAGLKPGGRHGLSEGFKRIVRKAGLDLETVKREGARNRSRKTFHSLRHSFTSALANAQVPEEIRMKLTGHTSKAIHTGYTHLEQEQLATAIRKLPNLPE